MLTLNSKTHKQREQVYNSTCKALKPGTSNLTVSSDFSLKIFIQAARKHFIIEQKICNYSDGYTPF